MINFPGYSFICKPYENLYDTPIEIGKYTSIAKGLRIVDIKHPSIENKKLVSNFAFKEDYGFPDYPANTGMGTIRIGNDVLIGAYCTLVAGITIGDGAIIKAGSLVSVDVPSYAIMQDNTIKAYRFDKFTRGKLSGIKWWDWKDEEINDRMSELKDIDLLLEKYL